MIKLLNGRSYEIIDLIDYTSGVYYIKNDKGEYTKEDDKSIFDINKIYYTLDTVSEKYIEVTNLYKPNTYYI
jgi:hypothetical protein